MGKQNSLYTFTGKLGNVVGMTDRKGQKTVRILVTPDNPNTINQIRARTRFLTANGLASAFNSAGALAGLRPTANSQQITLRNAFVKLNASGPNVDTAPIYTSLDPTTGDVESKLIWDEIVLSQGENPLIIAGQPEFTQANQIGLTLSNLTVGSIVHLVAFNQTQAEAVHQAVEVTTANQTFTLAVPFAWTGHEANVLFYTQTLPESISATEYTSYFDGGPVLAKAIRSALEAAETASTYTKTRYVGVGTIG